MNGDLSTEFSADFERPVGWLGWGYLRKMRWLVGEGVASDLFEAMEVLKGIGEWPSSREMGLVGGVYRPSRPSRSEGRRTTTRHREGMEDRESEPVICRGSVGRFLWD